MVHRKSQSRSESQDVNPENQKQRPSKINHNQKNNELTKIQNGIFAN